MSLRGRHPIRFGVALTLALTPALWASPALAASSSLPGSPCSNPKVSAENQYCEQIPSASGPHMPGPRTPALVTALPPRAVQQLLGPAHPAPAGSRAAAGRAATRRALLLLPAARRTPPLGGTGAESAVSASSLFPWLIAALAALALALGTAAIVQRRRSTGTPAE